MKIISIDQSLSHCAVVIIEDSKVIKHLVIRTGSTKSKSKQSKGVLYFETPVEQIIYIATQISNLAFEEQPDAIAIESLSFGSVGDATRDLAGLFYCIWATLVTRNGYKPEMLKLIAPTSAKAFGRKLLPEDEQKAPNKKGELKMVKMDKKLMIKAATTLEPDVLGKYNLAQGKGDIADAILIGHTYLSKA